MGQYRVMVVSTARVLEMKERDGGRTTKQKGGVERDGWGEYNGGRVRVECRRGRGARGWLSGYHAAQKQWQRIDSGETSSLMVVSTAVEWRVWMGCRNEWVGSGINRG